MLFVGFFFFSSRRRHTRWPRDWSSDVCSSDLSAFPVPSRLPSSTATSSHGLGYAASAAWMPSSSGATFSTSSYIGTTTESRCDGSPELGAAAAAAGSRTGSAMVVLQARGRGPRRTAPRDRVRDRARRDGRPERDEVDSEREREERGVGGARGPARRRRAGEGRTLEEPECAEHGEGEPACRPDPHGG